MKNCMYVFIHMLVSMSIYIHTILHVFDVYECKYMYIHSYHLSHIDHEYIFYTHHMYI